MDRYEELLAAGRGMKDEVLDADLRSLAADPRFAAVVGLIDRYKESFVNAGSSQGMAQYHGCLAHCMGSIDGLLKVQGRLRAVCSVKATGKRK